MKTILRTLMLTGVALTALPAAAQGELFVRQIEISAAEMRARAPRPADPSTFETALSDAIMRSGNARRAETGLPTLLGDTELAAAAQRYSQKMRDHGFFAHVSPQGETLAERLPEPRRGDYARLGENLWSAEGALDWRVATVSEQATADWILSPSHRDNLLEAAYSHAGVGVAVGGDKVYVTMLYARPREEPGLARFVELQSASAAPPPADLDGFARTLENRLIAEVNAFRARQGNAALLNAPDLATEARGHASETRDTSTHGGERLLRRVLSNREGRSQRLALAIWEGRGSLDWSVDALARAAVSSWEARPQTRTDLLDGGYDQAGIGVAADAEGVYISMLLSDRAIQAATVRLQAEPVTALQEKGGVLQQRRLGRYIVVE